MPNLGDIGNFPQIVADNKFKYIGEARNMLFQVEVPPVPMPVHPIPDEEPSFQVHFEEIDIVCPGWTKFITQNALGVIQCWSGEPLQAHNGFYVKRKHGDQVKTVAKPEDYEPLCLHIEELLNPAAAVEW